MNINMNRIQSLHPGHAIELIGFERADDSVHMIGWLRKGFEFRNFVVNDLEVELYAQNPDSQLLSVICKTDLLYETQARRVPGNEVTGVLTAMSVTFPLEVRVRAGNGVVWQLDVMQAYKATNMDLDSDFRLNLDLNIVSSRTQ
ncbi:hypothetical protein ACULMG_01060 [Xanthomonas arboricola pv. corylina]|uniref:hypothetical protein n=2 Tax=Xanthomonas arboricola TaxID=56448 RepID=UPI0015E4058C|nr:hypothetical protein [Xanthomonas arboricola]MDN0201658.1 hypothetical protein [Xanthomonas arboricola pv. corylina]MDN0206133.1 hypothetical protein [Xanthomonas arboricola pv. corylina]MDN0214875.1 hypothetical protein [Xanthomonas arboricola pv. corylina]UQQ10902.1 hypothetical protein KP021_00870 [Xanthomonas arboricola pv. corylina]UQQ16031.1 hypothetical protein KPG65_06285 [Xanthomonas arboricola pv. corylina]